MFKQKNAVSKDVVGMPLFDALLISLVVRFDSVGVFRSSFPSPLTKFSNNASLLAGNAGVAALQIVNASRYPPRPIVGQRL